MRFRAKFLLPYALASLLIFVIGRANSPIVPFDIGFLKGKELQGKVQELRIGLWKQVDKELIEAGRFEERFREINSTLDVIIDDGRERFNSQPRWISDGLACGLLLLGFIVATIRSWSMDVKCLKEEIAEAKQVEPPN